MTVKHRIYTENYLKTWLLSSLIIFLVCPMNMLASHTPSKAAAGPTCDIVIQLPDPSERMLCGEQEFDLCANVIAPTSQVDVIWLADGDFYSDVICDDPFLEETTEFTLIATYTDDVNLIVNGDFEDGNNDFDTTYDIVPGPCSPGFELCDGYYAIWDETGQGHPAFASCGDHTSGSGLMMAINGIVGIPELWCQEVCLDPDASYILSGWGTSVIADSPAQLSFTVDGDFVGDEVDLGTNLCNWVEFTGEFDADGENSVEICIYNENPDMQGNDFAIDDIEMYQVCTAQESMIVTVSEMTLTPVTSGDITCTNNMVDVSINVASSQAVSSAMWNTTNGTIVTNVGFGITVSSAGTYNVTITDDAGCEFPSQVTVTEQIVLPTASIQGDTLISCDNSELVLGSLTNAVTPLYEWKDSLGIIVGMADTLIVMKDGEYELTVIDPVTGCSNVDTVIVTMDTAAPSFDLQKSGDFTCYNTMVELNTTVPQSFVTWSSNNGTIITDTDDRITITQAGEYYAQSGTPGGCTHIDTIVVTVDTTFPAFDLVKSGDLTCNNTSVEINTSIPQTNMSWTSNNGTLITDTDDRITVTEAGEYYAQISSPGGCMHIDTIVVSGIIPSFDYTKSPDDNIDCDNPSADIAITYDANNYDFTWVGSASSLGTNNQVPISDAGTYTFQLTDANGCQKLDSVMIAEDFFVPQIFTDADLITCTQSNAEVSISWLDQVVYIDEVDWVLPDGNAFTDGTTTTSSQPGWVKFTAYVITNGCTIEDSILVEASNDFPTASITGDTLNCNTSVVTLNSQTSADVISFEWTLPDGSTDGNTDLQITEGGKYILEVSNSSGCNSFAEYNVVEDLSVPTIDLDPFSTITCIDTVVSADITIPEPYSSLSWRGPNLNIDSLNLQALEAGDYELEVIGTNGCIATATLMVAMDTIPTSGWDLLSPAMSTATLSCTQDTIETAVFMDQSEVREFVWLTPSGNNIESPIIDITEPGTYLLSVTGDNGCPAYDTLFIDQATDLPTFTSSATEITCSSDSITISASSASTDLSYDFVQASTGMILGSGEEITIEVTDDIQLIATDDNGCSAIQQIDFTYDTLSTDFTLAADILSCSLPSTEIELTSSSAVTQQTIYSEAGDLLGDETYEVTEAGTYTVTATGDNGCPSSETIFIDIDTMSVFFELSAPILGCDATDIPISFLILEPFVSAERVYTENGEREEILEGESFSPVLDTGIYTYTVTGLNGCTSVEEIEVIRDESTISYNLSAAPLTCENISTTIVITTTENYTDGYAVDLNTLETYDDITDLSVSNAGIYEVHLTGTNGCESIQTIEIEANADVPSLEAIDVETINCDGNGQINELTITGGNPPYMISIDGGPLVTFAPELAVSSGPHELYVEDMNGCSFRSTFTPDPVDLLTGTTELEVVVVESTDRQLLVEVNKPEAEITTIQWSPMIGLSCYDCLDPQYTGFGSTNYEIYIQDKYGCELSLETRVLAEEPSGVYVPNFISISDNSDNGGFTIYSKESSQVLIKNLNIYDRWGNLIFVNSDFAPNDKSQGWKGNYNNKSVAPGVYIYMATVEYRDGTTEIFAGDLTVID